MPIDPWLAEYNSILKESDNFYRSAARRLKIPECTLWILYTLRAEPAPLTQKRLCQIMCQPKQTVNSALKHLEAEGFLTLTAGEDRRTRVVQLTPQGEALADRTANHILQAEEQAFRSMSPQEAEELLRLFRKYVQFLKLDE